MVETGASTKFSQCREKALTRAFSLLSRLKSPALTWLVAGGGTEMEYIYNCQHLAAVVSTIYSTMHW